MRPFSEAVKLFLANQFSTTVCYILTYRSVHLFTTRWKKRGEGNDDVYSSLLIINILFYLFFGFFATGPTSA